MMMRKNVLSGNYSKFVSEKMMLESGCYVRTEEPEYVYHLVSREEAKLILKEQVVKCVDDYTCRFFADLESIPIFIRKTNALYGGVDSNLLDIYKKPPMVVDDMVVLKFKPRYSEQTKWYRVNLHVPEDKKDSISENEILLMEQFCKEINACRVCHYGNFKFRTFANEIEVYELRDVLNEWDDFFRMGFEFEQKLNSGEECIIEVEESKFDEISKPLDSKESSFEFVEFAKGPIVVKIQVDEGVMYTEMECKLVEDGCDIVADLYFAKFDSNGDFLPMAWHGKVLCHIDFEGHVSDAHAFRLSDEEGIEELLIGGAIRTFFFLLRLPQLYSVPEVICRESANSMDSHHTALKSQREWIDDDRPILLNGFRIEYASSVKTGRTNQRHIESWEVRGHFRRYKSGKTVYIKPFVKGERTKVTKKQNYIVA